MSDQLETAVVAAASRKGWSIDDYLAMICEEALSLKVNRQRLPSHLDGAPGVSQERDNAWLSDLAAGKRSECPR